MKPIRLLVDSFADADEINSQMTNARDIVARLDPDRFHVTMFCCGEPHTTLARRPQTYFIRLGKHRQTPRILQEFLLGRQRVLFYLKASPAAKLYLDLRSKWFDRRIVIGSIESQCDPPKDETVKEEQVRLWQQTILRSDILFSNSSFVQESLKKYYGLTSQVIPTGVDSKFFSPDWESPRALRPRVLFAGSLRRFKGPQLLIEAASRFPNADFVLVGDGPEASNLRKRIQEVGLPNCELVGALHQADLREQYRRADIFLFPSHWEGSPKVVLEAAACGLPVVARGDYGLETVIHGKTGFLGGSDRELLDYVQVLLSSYETCRSMGKASRELSERFDWNIIARRWEEAFSRAAFPAGGRP